MFHGTRREQDEIVRRVVAEFADAARAPKVKDRRAEPVAGYRAVHVVASVLDVPVEIQVRTWHQDQWAQIVERLGDVWGRGIRYGDAPPEPDRLVPGAKTRAAFWESVQTLARLTASYEELEVVLQEGMEAPWSGASDERTRSLEAASAALDRGVAGLLRTFADIVEDLQ